MLTPCPEGWTEKTEASGQVTCEPGPLPSRECAPGWNPRVLLEGTPLQYSVCEPGPLPSWECPDGWEAVPLLEGTPQAYSACRPPALPESCPAGEMSVVGQVDCQPIGDLCPEGDYPTNLPTGKMVVYAKAGATGGDGSLARPFGTLGEALAAAPEGGVIAVGTGTYVENLKVSKEVSLWGVCVTGVSLVGTGPTPELWVTKGGSVEVRNLAVGGQGVGLLVQAGGLPTAQGVWVHQATGVGIEASGGTLSLSGVLVSETAARSDKTDGYGVWFHGGSLELEPLAGVVPAHLANSHLHRLLQRLGLAGFFPAHDIFHLFPRIFHRVQVRRIPRQDPVLASVLPRPLAASSGAMSPETIGNHDIAWAHVGAQLMGDVMVPRVTIRRSLEAKGRQDPSPTQGHHQRNVGPRIRWGRPDRALTAGGTGKAPRHAEICAEFIDKNQLRGATAASTSPEPPSALDVRPFLLAGVKRFFLVTPGVARFG